MNEDYLWDKTGEPDPEVERLEKLLAPLAHKPGPAPALSARKPSGVPRLFAIAASVLVIAAASWIVWQRTRPAWVVSALEGAPSVRRVTSGQSFQTDAHSRARLVLESVGEIEVEPDTRLSVISIKPDQQRFDLKRGTIRATIWAPPGRFFVDTPSAQAVDLGCAYTLQVDDNGIGLVRVTAGWVAFDSNGRESFIPASAACVTRPAKGPGIPYYEDASARLQEAVARFDTSGDPASVLTILSEARSRDAITLWHLLRRVDASSRGVVYDRLAELIQVPGEVNRQGIVAGDGQMIETLWNALDLGDTSWWRLWKSRMPR
jgi:hypothetical protein